MLALESYNFQYLLLLKSNLSRKYCRVYLGSKKVVQNKRRTVCRTSRMTDGGDEI